MAECLTGFMVRRLWPAFESPSRSPSVCVVKRIIRKLIHLSPAALPVERRAHSCSCVHGCDGPIGRQLCRLRGSQMIVLGRDAQLIKIDVQIQLIDGEAETTGPVPELVRFIRHRETIVALPVARRVVEAAVFIPAVVPVKRADTERGTRTMDDAEKAAKAMIRYVENNGPATWIFGLNCNPHSPSIFNPSFLPPEALRIRPRGFHFSYRAKSTDADIRFMRDTCIGALSYGSTDSVVKESIV